MSYLVDALKKAERERHARRSQDIHALSASGGPGTSATRGGAWLWLVAILVASNVALAIYIWRPRPANSPPNPVTQRHRAPPTENMLARITTGTDAPGMPKTRPVTPASTTDDRASTDARRTPRTGEPGRSESDGRRSANTAQATRDDRPVAHGRVTYSKVPLSADADDATPADDEYASRRRAADTPDQSELSNVPSVDINGQLYSSVPGRSFILVDGRRYHEGERLASGPAVESIEPGGATLRYHGQRYHVAGPG